MELVSTSRSALVAAIAVLLVGVAAAAGRAWLLEPNELPPVPPGSQAVHAKAEEIYARIMGTPSQRAASGGLFVWAQNSELDRCMAEEGYPDWGGFRPIPEADVDPLATGTWLAEPHRRVLSAGRVSQDSALEFDVEQNNVEIGPAEDAAITDCSARTTHGSGRHALRVSEPRHTRALWQAWGQMVLGYATAEHDPDEYVECMVEADVRGLDAALLREGGALDYAATGIDAPPGPAPTSPDDPLAETEEWHDFLEDERVATDADWRCRAEVYAELIAGLLPLIEEFEAEHAQELAQTEAEWAEIEERAADVFG